MIGRGGDRVAGVDWSCRRGREQWERNACMHIGGVSPVMIAWGGEWTTASNIEMRYGMDADTTKQAKDSRLLISTGRWDPLLSLLLAGHACVDGT